MDECELYRLPFSIQRHKSMPYHVSLEVVIAPDGTVEYALPSHQEYLIAKAMEKKGVSREKLMDECPPEYYFNFLEWLVDESGGYLPVWERWTVDANLTLQQKNALRKLKLAGLYRGNIP